MDEDSLLGETVAYINKLQARLKQLEGTNSSAENRKSVSFVREGLEVTTAGPKSPTQDLIAASPNTADTLRIEIVRNDSSQEDTAIQLFSCIRDLELTVNHAAVSTDVQRIHATLIVNIPSSRSGDHYGLCNEIEIALRRCLP